MIISKKNKFIYLAVPKTGTTSVQKFLLENDNTATNYNVELDGNQYRFGEHMTALEIKNVLGDLYNNYTVIGFVRHPYGRIVSSYFFYKKGGKDSWKGREHQRSLGDKLRIKFAKIMPFKLWALIYPYKSNREYFLDADNNLIVDLENIGLFENLGQDLKEILSRADIILENEIPHENKSFHSGPNKYFKNGIFRRLVNFKVKRDLEFYNMVASKKQ